LEPGFLDNLRGGSLDLVELVMMIEENFGTEIPVREAEKLRDFRTIQEAIDYMRKHKKGGSSN
jgi:acyl carrier protein